MSDFYAELRDEVASPILAEFKQGTVTLTRSTPGTPNPDEPWVPVAPTTVVYTLDAVVSAVTVDQAAAKYIDGTLITAGDLVVTLAVPAVVPQMSDTLALDGEVHSIKKIVPIPAVGTVVAYKIFVQG